MSFSAVNRLRIAKLAIVARMQPGEIFGLKQAALAWDVIWNRKMCP